MSDAPGEAVQVSRSAFVAVVGRPNAGKSTLVNRIVGSHIAIVSPIAQTTRRLIRAVAHLGEVQLVFCDLPGSQRPMDRLTERMQRSLVSALKDVDTVLWVIDASVPPKGGEKAVARLVADSGLPVVIALNKVDLLKPAQIAERISQIDELATDYQALVPVSAVSGDGCDAVVSELAALAEEGPAFYEQGQLTDETPQERITELVREAALRHLREELPHALAVELDELEEDDDGRPQARCTIWVERDSQVGIVVGSKGSMIRNIGTMARQTITQALGMPVHLELRVKVRERWRNDDATLARWGL